MKPKPTTPAATTTQSPVIPHPKNEKAGLFTRLHHSLRRNTYSRKLEGFTGVASLRTSK